MGFISGICHFVLRHGKANNKYKKIDNRDKRSLCLIYLFRWFNYLDIKIFNLYGGAVSQKLPVGEFD